MPRINLVAGTKYQLDGKTYEIKKVYQGGKLEVVELDMGYINTITTDFIEDALYNGDLRFAVQGKNTIANENSSINISYKWEDFDDVEEKYRIVAWYRYSVIREIERIPPEQRAVQRIISIAESVIKSIDNPCKTPLKAKSFRSIMRWRHDYLKSGCDIRSLVPSYYRCGGGGKSRLSGEMDEIINDAIGEEYMNHHRKSPTKVYFNMINRVAQKNEFRDKNIIKPVSQSTIYNRVSIINPHKSTEARYGKRFADKEYRETMGGLVVERPLQRIEMDNTIADILIVDEVDRLPIGRPTITSSIDKFTTEPGGINIAFEPPSSITALLCLRHTIMKKNYIQEKYPQIKNPWNVYGIPENIALDGGKDFQSRDFENACLQLKIGILDMPVKVPWYKGSIERFFRTINEELLHDKPGTTFSNFLERGDYNPHEMAVLSLSAFWELLHIFICDIYTQKYNTGIKGIPSRVWNENIANITRSYPPSIAELETLCYCTDFRTIQKYGIDFLGLRYNDEQLSVIRSNLHYNDTRKVKIKYNPNDISQIRVCDNIVSNQYISVKAIDQEYTQGLSIWKHNVITEYVRKTRNVVDIYALAKAKAEIQKVVDREWRETKKTRTMMARYKGVGSNIIIGNRVDDNTSPNTGTAVPRSSIENKPYKGISDQDHFPGSRNSKNKALDIKKEQDVKGRGIRTKVDTQYSGSLDSRELDISGWNNSYSLKK